MDPILQERDDAIATVVLNRPDKLNALNREAWARLEEVMRELSQDNGVRCIVLRGAGEKAFAAGADISEFENERSNVEQAREYGNTVDGAMASLVDCRHPTLAMIRGVCVGGGLEVACACDLRICGSSSRFGVPVNRLGLTMAYRELELLLSLIGHAAALEILLEGKVFGAEKAAAIGLLNRVVPDDRVQEEAYATARRIAEAAPLVNRWHKKSSAGSPTLDR